MCSFDGGEGGKLVRCLDGKAYSVTNCEWCESLPYLQANKLACYSFMNTDRRHKTPDSTNQFIIPSNNSSQHVIICSGFPSPSGHRALQ